MLLLLSCSRKKTRKDWTWLEAREFRDEKCPVPLSLTSYSKIGEKWNLLFLCKQKLGMDSHHLLLLIIFLFYSEATKSSSI